MKVKYPKLLVREHYQDSFSEEKTISRIVSHEIRYGETEQLIIRPILSSEYREIPCIVTINTKPFIYACLIFTHLYFKIVKISSKFLHSQRGSTAAAIKSLFKNKNDYHCYYLKWRLLYIYIFLLHYLLKGINNEIPSNRIFHAVSMQEENGFKSGN